MRPDGILRRAFDWAVCGYSRGRGSSFHSRGWSCGTDTRRGRLVMWLLNLDMAVRRSPESFHWWLADLFAQWALRLRGQRVTVFGYYDAARGNRASELADRLRLAVVLEAVGGDEDARSAIEDLNELESLAGGCWWRNNTRPDSLERCAADLQAAVTQVRAIARTHLMGDELTEAAGKIRQAQQTVATVARRDRALAARKA